VLGSRGIGPIQRLLLGSVSTAVPHRTGCPLVVVPDDR
jgi:nucleotide-binding universal stress UspA family protein